jgi:phosphoglycolate phosphatase
MIRAAIFDFDGTLTPLTLDFSLLRARIEELAREYVEEDVIASQANQYIIEMIHAIGDMLQKDGPIFQERAFRELCILEVEASSGKALYPYTREVFARLKAKGVRIGIITRTCIEVIRTVFPDMDAYVDAVVTRDHTRYVKPNPEQVRIALACLGIAPAEAILTGDHPTDIEAGKAFGTITAGVLTGRTTAPLFAKAGAHHIFDDIRGIVELIGDR